MISGVDSISPKGVQRGTSLPELLTRVQDIESRLPMLEEPNSNEVPIKQLPSSATLADVISVVNELIKRDLTRKKVQ